MTDSHDPAPAEKQSERLGRPPLFIILVFSAVILLAAGWSAIWYFGTQKAGTMMTEWLASEAARGRKYDCGERAIGGYPFRVEITCTSPTLDIADSSPRIRLAADNFHAVAQVWNLTHVIFEIEGPVRVEVGGRRKRPDSAFDADWTLLQGSVRAPGGEVSRVDLAITELTGQPDPDTLPPGAGATVTAARVDLHGRNAAVQGGRGRDYDLALDAEDLVVALAGQTPPDAVDASFVGRLDAMPYPPPREPGAFVAAWRENGGSIGVERLSVAQGDSEIRAIGRVTPDGAGQPEGTVKISLAGPDITAPGSAGAFGGLAPIMALALRLTGKPGEIDGRTALSGELELREGKVFLGPVPIFELPRLY